MGWGARRGIWHGSCTSRWSERARRAQRRRERFKTSRKKCKHTAKSRLRRISRCRPPKCRSERERERKRERTTETNRKVAAGLQNAGSRENDKKNERERTTERNRQVAAGLPNAGLSEREEEKSKKERKVAPGLQHADL